LSRPDRAPPAERRARPSNDEVLPTIAPCPGESDRALLPETRYTQSGDIHIAYQVIGEAETDLVLVAEFWHAIEAQWEEPALATFLRGLNSFGRLISFDQRGTGISDPVPPSELPSLEQWLDDIRSVMDAAGSRRAVLIGTGGGGTLSMLFAATYPERTSGLVLVNSFPRISQAPDYPWGRAPALEEEVVHVMRTGWGLGVDSLQARSATSPSANSGRGTNASAPVPARSSECGGCSTNSTSATFCRAFGFRPSSCTGPIRRSCA
jgi:pimeloyl-ACP methyl ester carboxylesterase